MTLHTTFVIVTAVEKSFAFLGSFGSTKNVMKIICSPYKHIFKCPVLDITIISIQNVVNILASKVHCAFYIIVT